MTQVEISLAERTIGLTLGMPLDGLRRALGDVLFAEGEDEEVSRHDFMLHTQGIDIVCKHGVVSTVFFYIVPEVPRADCFTGEIDLLPEGFFKAPSEQAFVDALAERGFARSTRTYPNNPVDMLNSQQRLRFEQTARQTVVMMDDGAFLR